MGMDGVGLWADLWYEVEVGGLYAMRCCLSADFYRFDWEEGLFEDE